MARKPRLLHPNGLYHVTFRGNARQAIFLNERDRHRLCDRLAESAEDYGVHLHFYCFMTNHVHLVLRTPKANLSAFMSSLLTGYTVYFNRRHQRVGHLLQGRYGAQMVEGEEYLLRLSRYVHLNPVRTEAWRDKALREQIAAVRAYRWSSYRAYAGLAAREEHIEYESLLGSVPGRGRPEMRYRRYVEAGLAQTDEEWVALMKDHPLAIGSGAFVAQVQNEYAALAGSRVKEEDLALRRVPPSALAEEVLLHACNVFRIKADELRRKRRDGRLRALTALALVRHTGQTQRQIASLLGMRTGAAVSYLLRRAKQIAPTDPLAPKLLNYHFKG